MKTAKASAWLEGRDYVTPGDIREQFPYVVSHRLRLNAAARMEGLDKGQIIGKVLEQTPCPPMGDNTSRQPVSMAFSAIRFSGRKRGG